MGQEPERYEPPKPTAGDTAHALTRAGLGSLPYVGAAAAELFGLVVTPSLERRRVEWMNEVAEGLRRLEQKGRCRLEDLAQNEVFIDTVLTASAAAIRTSQQEKREALGNAVLNSALPNPPDESRRQMFLHWVDTFTVWHLRILVLFADPRRWFERQGRKAPEHSISSSLDGLLLEAYPELKGKRDLYDQVVKDIHNCGLLGTNTIHSMMSAHGALSNRATELGQQFLDFVTAPPEQ